ncbi:isoflavone reductase [Exophiala viscosa]|uniref:Isoflavone reductase n=1 Tax=Exophiala viscosa TaxID=2486360 RepID=A0AAN6E113_9EURO|nr:isoflavone reductase [Exophiala viscosa]KAI1624010.1 isoflavone reductase [Exophiala viscosa]
MPAKHPAACKKLLIIGATGLIGKYITLALVQSKSKFDRIAILTSADTVQNKVQEIEDLKKEGVDIIVGDVTNFKDVVDAYRDIDTVISAVGRNVIEHQVELIRLANDSDTVHRFFPSEYGTDIEYSPASANEKPHQKKLIVRAAMKSCDNLDYTYVVTGPYADLCLGPMMGQLGSFDVIKKEAVLLDDGNLKTSYTTMRDVGNLVTLAALHPEVSRNKALKVNSFTATDMEILQEFEEQTGNKWKISYTSMGQLKKIEQEAWSNGAPMATGATLRRIWAEGGTLYEKRDNDLIEAENVVDTLEDAVAEAIKQQTKSMM